MPKLFGWATLVTQLRNWAKMAVSLPILKLGSQFFGRCRYFKIGNFQLMLPKSIWAFFQLPTIVTQLQNWAEMAVSLPISPIFKLGSQFFGRCHFLKIGNFHLMLPKSRALAQPTQWAIFGYTRKQCGVLGINQLHSSSGVNISLSKLVYE